MAKPLTSVFIGAVSPHVAKTRRFPGSLDPVTTRARPMYRRRGPYDAAGCIRDALQHRHRVDDTTAALNRGGERKPTPGSTK